MATAIMPKLSMATAGAALIALGATFANVQAASAAIITVGDAGSWATGTNTLSGLGFDMVTVPDNPATPEFAAITSLSSPLGDLTFTPGVEKRRIGSSWGTWSHGYTGEVYWSNGLSSITIDLPSAIAAFDLYVEPNLFDFFDITVTAVNGVATSLTQSVTGSAGAKYFGFYATDGDLISSITVTAPQEAQGFAMGEFRLAKAKAPEAVPEPASVLGVVMFGALGAGSILKRKQEQKA